MNAEQDPTETNALRTLCKGAWMSGSLRVVATAEGVVLRKRHFPVLCAIWCYGIMGVVTWIGWRWGSQGIGIGMGVMGAAMATFFVAMAVHLDRKPAVLEYDLRERVLLLPRSAVALNSPVRLGWREVAYEMGDGRTRGGALYVAREGEAEGVPIYVEPNGRNLRARVERFAKLARLPVFTLPKVAV